MRGVEGTLLKMQIGSQLVGDADSSTTSMFFKKSSKLKKA